jgi:DNA processing protein
LAQVPEVLFCKGNLEILKRPIVAIVGTRNATRYGLEVAKKLAGQLAELGIVVVSGLADGIDAAAHSGAGAANTIAVLGNGINQFYPAANVDLQKGIAKDGGLLISEYSPNAKSNKYTFPQRNRIIAALAKAVIIVEADIKSGSLITKDFALDLGREVFAVPGPITSPASQGTNEMIKTAACACLTDISDVLSVFGMTYTNAKANTVTQISFEAQIVLDILKFDEIHFDELIQRTNFAPKVLTTLLTKMEMDGIIQKLPGNYYVSKLGK